MTDLPISPGDNLPPLSTDTQPRSFNASDFTATIAAELAAQIHEPSAIFEKFGLTDAEAKLLLSTPRFQKMVKQAAAEWKALDNTEKRVRYKALVAIEELMPSLFSLVSDQDNPASSRNETFKTFMKLANLERPADTPTTGARFSVTINLPDTQPTQLAGTVIDEDEE